MPGHRRRISAISKISYPGDSNLQATRINLMFARCFKGCDSLYLSPSLLVRGLCCLPRLELTRPADVPLLHVPVLSSPQRILVQDPSLLIRIIFGPQPRQVNR